MKLTEFCINRPVTTGMFYLALLVLGLISSSLMPIDLFPEVNYPAINIRTVYSGAGPEEIERLITIPIEQAVSTINGVKSITATSEEESSRVTVHFDWGYDLDEAANDIRANLDRVRRRLPDEADTPTIFKFDPSMSPILTLGLSGEQDEAYLRKLADDDLSYLLQRIDGVAQVEVRGGKSQEIRVYLKQDRMQAFGITAEQLVAAIDRENSMTPAGYLAVGVGDYLLRTKGELQTLDEIGNLVVAQRDGIPVYLKDLATIEQGYETTRQLTRIDGKPGIVLSISKRSGANTVAVADRVYKALDEIKLSHPDINLRILNDSSIYIRQAVNSVSDSAVAGGVLAALILLFFFHNFRATLITGITMPVSILATLILAYFFKMTLNTISLGGLALGVGMLVDNSVVVLDNIFRHYHKNGGNIKAAALNGTAEMGGALSSSTLTTVCVFFPLIYLSGRNGIIFKELSYMVIFSLLCSLLVAITLIPVLCARFLKVHDLNETEVRSLNGRLVKMQNGWEKSYGEALKWCLNHKATVILSGIGLFLVSLVLFPLIGTELVQTTDEGVIRVNLQMPTGTRLEETDRVSKELEQFIRENLPELANMEVSVGGSNSHKATLTLRLKSKAERRRSTQQVVDYLNANLAVPGARLRIQVQNSMRLLYGGSDPVEIDIRGYDQQQARKVATEVMDIISRIPGITNVTMSREEERPELDIIIDRKRASDYGITTEQITAAVQINIEGKVATTLRRNGEEIEVRVNLQEADRQTWQDLGRIMVSGSNNRVVPLSSLVSLVQTNSPVGIERKDQERNVTVSADLEKRDLDGAIRDVQAAIRKVNLPEGIRIYYAGDYEEQKKSFQEFQTVILLALLLVYMVMASQFESFFDPFVIMLSVPFALSGVILILLLTDTLFNTQVYLGLILLGGVVVNNAIVLISYIRILMEQGMDLETAVLEGSKSRLRPVLITTLTTVIGLIPMALGIGEGAETQAPLARTVLGGLTFSTVLTLVLIPVIFATLESRLMKIKYRWRKSSVAAILLILLVLITSLSPLRAETVPLRKLTVTDAVSLALQNNEDSKIFQKKREIAEAAYKETMGEKEWKLFSTLESGQIGQSDSETELSLNLEKSVPLVNLFGVRSLADQVAEYNRKATLYNIEWQEQQFIYEVIDLFQQELLAKRDWELAAENYQRAKHTYEEVLTRSKLGLTTVSDETGAAAQKAAAATNLNRSHQLYQLAQLKLRQRLGLPEKEKLELVGESTPSDPVVLDDLLAKARQNRADLKAAKVEQETATVLLKLAQLSQRLGIALNWEFNRDHFQVGAGLSNQEANDETAGEWSISGIGKVRLNDPKITADHKRWGTVKLTLRWNFLDGNIRKERIKQARLLTEQMAEALKKAEKNLAYEVQEAYYNYLHQLEQLRSSELQLKYNQTYFEATRAKLRVGLATVKDVLDAQVLLNQAEVSYERTKTAVYLARMNLRKVCGELNPHR